MANNRVAIDRLIEPNESDVEGLARLLPQLSSAQPPSLDELRKIIDDRDLYLYIARLEGKIVGSLSLVVFCIPTGTRAWIEDVVVDTMSRGQGIASSLLQHAIDTARSLGARNVDLTSRPTRQAANRLYVAQGFNQRETNVYRYEL